MRTLAKPLLALNATDLMTTPVVPLAPDMSLPAAAQLLCHAQISGAPVVDRTGRLIGVLSANDFLACCHGDCIRTHVTEEVYSPWQMLEAESRHEETVRDHMTMDPVTATPATPLANLARMMLDAHIHRVVVVDREHRPIGIVSSTDILAALAYADPED